LEAVAVAAAAAAAAAAFFLFSASSIRLTLTYPSTTTCSNSGTGRKLVTNSRAPSHPASRSKESWLTVCIEKRCHARVVV
jgi:hypothetical protein